MIKEVPVSPSKSSKKMVEKKDRGFQIGQPGNWLVSTVATQTPRPKENDYRNVKSRLFDGVSNTKKESDADGNPDDLKKSNSIYVSGDHARKLGGHEHNVERSFVAPISTTNNQ